MARIDADEVAPGLWQGSIPPQGDVLRRAGFGVLVLCAREHQPSGAKFPEVVTLHAPMEDAELDTATWATAVRAARAVADARLRGQRALVTCAMGLNRSGLVSALSLMIFDGMNGSQAVARVKSRRPMALFNESFVRALKAPRR